MATYVAFFTNAGVPAAGLTPTITTLQEMDGDPVAPPVVAAIGGGFYSFTLVPAQDLLAVIDGGAALGASDRYLHAMLTPRDANPSLVSRGSVPGGAAFSDLDDGNGVRQRTLVINDGVNPIPNAKVSVFVASTETYVASAVTPASGTVVFALNDGSYDIRVFAPGYTFTVPTVLVVAATGSTTISGVSAVPAAPADATLCRVYLDAILPSGAIRPNTRVTVENLFSNPIQAKVLVDSGWEYTSGASSGRVQFDLPRGGRFRIGVVDTPINKEIIVPDLATANLATLLGSPVDSFTVIVA